MSPLTKLLRRAALAVSVGAVSLGLTACSVFGGGAASVIAALVPVSAPIYIEIAVRPTGGVESGARDAIGKVMGGDAEQAIGGLRSQVLSDTGLDYEGDVAPWLGEHAGIFFTSLAGSEPEGAVVIESTDEGGAEAAVKKAAEHEPESEQREHRGVSYYVTDDSDATALVDGFVVAGSEAGVKAVIDTSEGDDSLEDADGFDAIERLPEERLGALYADLGAIVKLAGEQGGVSAEQLGPLSGQLDRVEGATLAGALRASGESIVVEGEVIGLPEGSAKTPGGELIRSLPGDATLGLALGNLGEQVSKSLDEAEGQPGFRDATQALQAFAGLDVERDIVPWLGEGTLFAGGAGLTDLSAGLLIHSTDEDASRAAIEKLRKAAESLNVQGSPLGGGLSVGDLQVDGAEGFTVSGALPIPLPVEVAARGDSVVVAVGSGAVKKVLDPGDTLGESEAFSGAAGGLGDEFEPIGYLAVGPLADLLSGFASQASPEDAAQLEQATAVAKRFGALAIGAAGEGDTASFKLVLTLE